MTIILFLIDTSASMNARTYLGARPTLLDVSKDAVEKFLKIRQRDQASRGDRYMLLTFEESPANIKAGWKEHHNIFMTELKNLTANGMTTLGPALKNCFDLLNLNRMQTGIDTYGQGRCPYFLEPSIIIVITDGGKLTNTSNVQEELNLPMNSYVPGSELTKEPFRWDQRLFALVLRLTGTPPEDQYSNSNTPVPYDSSPIDAMCEVTGGRSYMVSSQRTLMQCLESIVQKIQNGVVIHFEKYGPDPPIINDEANSNGLDENIDKLESKLSVININPNSQFKSWHTCRKQIYVQRSTLKGYSVGHWPIPEAFSTDLNSTSLPPRTCHPIVKFICTNTEPMIIENLPFDKYEIEPCQLTNYILLRKQPHVAWQCFISNSCSNANFYNVNSFFGKNDLGFPFGYLKASTNLTCVNFYVLPYNYPVLLPLLDELFKIHHGKPSKEWKASFDCYLKDLPFYYTIPLKRALQRMSAPLFISELVETCMSYTVSNYLKRLKNQAKIEFEKLIASVGKSSIYNQTDAIKLVINPFTRRLHDLVLNDENSNRNDKSNESILTKNQKYLASIRTELNEFNGFIVRVKDKMKESKLQCYKNAFDISRNELIDQMSRMKTNFLQKNISDIRLFTEEQLHSLPVSQMGNYQEYLKKMQPSLRELEQQPVRQHMFGNPFKFDKKVQMMVDEADIDMLNNNMVNGKGKRPNNEICQGRLKRKPGPLPKDFVLQRPGSPVISNMNNNNSFSLTTLNDKNQIVNNHDINTLEKLEIDQISNKNITVEKSFLHSHLSPNLSNDLNVLISSPTSIELFDKNHEEVEPIKDQLTSSLINNNVNKSNSIKHLVINNNYTQNSFNNCIKLSEDEKELKKLLFKIVRRPGNNYDNLINLLNKHNNHIVKDYLVQQVISEANRFKKRNLVHLLVKKFPLTKAYLNGS